MFTPSSYHIKYNILHTNIICIIFLFDTIFIMGDLMNLIPVVFDNEKKNLGLDLYSKLLDNRIIFISGVIDDDISNIVIAELLYLDSVSNDDIYLYINSVGGSVSSGLAIYDTMNLVHSDICTLGIGTAASMGALLLSSGTVGKRYSLPNTNIMIHQVLSSFEGCTNNIKDSTDRMIELQKNLNKILSKNTKKSIKKIENDIKKDFYMSAVEACEYGLIDKVL